MDSITTCFDGGHVCQHALFFQIFVRKKNGRVFFLIKSEQFLSSVFAFYYLCNQIFPYQDDED